MDDLDCGLRGKRAAPCGVPRKRAIGLVAGTYRGSISISFPSIANPVVIPVVLSLTSAGATPGAITSVTVANGGTGIAQNAWIAIKGTNLVPNNTPAGGVVWSSAPEFATGRMPLQLGGYPVTVTVNNKPAYFYFFCSAATSTICTSDQINVLTPLDNTIGPVPVVVTNNGVATVRAGTTLMRTTSSASIRPGRALPSYKPPVKPERIAR